MKIVFIGYGKMGKAIEKIAVKSGHTIVNKIGSNNKEDIKKLNESGADMAFEFTRPETAFENIMTCFENNIPVVCGTTGWLDKLGEIENYCRKNNQSFFYSTNYSIGVNLFFEVNSLLAKLMDSQSQYDEILIHESHHSGKLDSPSGTAITLANQVITRIKRLKSWVNYKTDDNVNLGAASDSELAIFSTREDEVPGTHIVKYFSDVDEIEIVHKALSREGFAVGALSAAEWLIGKKGSFGMKDLLNL